MTILNIKLMPDPVLRMKAESVKLPSEEVNNIFNDMADTMYDAPGIGLAANQVGILKRLIVMDCSTEEEEPKLWKMINPEIVSVSIEKEELEEGCLSIPEHKSAVVRPKEVVVEFINISGQKETLEAKGLLAACVQHEIDHLNGILFIDHISRLKRDIIVRKVKKLARENKDGK